jgi:hypothetical protein
MKMLFSINKKPNLPINKPPVEKKQNSIEKNELFQAISYSFRYGMMARVQNTSNCSSCGK